MVTKPMEQESGLKRIRLSDRILYALDLALQQEDVYISEMLVKALEEKNIVHDHPHVYFSQLLGMSDHISFNLSSDHYNVAKYVPYGPVKEVLPYLIRRAQENTSVKGQTGRELSLIIKEKKRRRK